LSLSRPEIAVRFVSNGKVVFQTVGNGDLRAAIYVLHGREVAAEALPFSYAQGAVRVSGFVGVGNLARSNRSYELFFVNGRFVRDAALSGAVEAACRERVMIGKYPYCVLNLSIPVEAVDVNVHPNKLEVRFKEDFPVREHVQSAVESAFADDAATLRTVAPEAQEPASQQEAPPPTDQDAPPAPEQIAMAQPTFGSPVRPEGPAVLSDFSARRDAAPVLRETAQPLRSEPTSVPWRDASSVQHAAPVEPPAEKRFVPPRVEPLGTAPIVIGQAFSTYLLVQRGDALLIIDQHAAHERILYEKFRQQVDEERRSQPLLTPYLFHVTLREEELLLENLDRLRSMGFEIEPFGERSFRVSAVPVLLGAPQTKDFFVELLDQLDNLPSTKVKDLKRDALVKMACKKAIKGGDPLSAQEVNALLALVAGEETPTCPHGRPILIPITRHELERKFKRIQ
ncbi:MAG: DNA mismatch repair endonuclease MutL, partial [Candidatus Spyradocola sp.]